MDPRYDETLNQTQPKSTVKERQLIVAVLKSRYSDEFRKIY